ncbi:unnamed protein product, partial [Mycena citricolor]
VVATCMSCTSVERGSRKQQVTDRCPLARRILGQLET